MSEIAVVIPCYNLGRTVEQALDSVVTQTRGAAEIVVVDDGSTDLYTRQLLASLRRPRTRVMRTENHGLPAARNYGIRHTTAPYIVTLDADDYLDPTYLEKTAARLDAEPEVGFVSTAIHGFEGADYVWTPPPCDLVSAFTRGTVHPATMFRRELWQGVDGYDEAFVGGCEDLDFWISAMARGFRGEIIDKPLLHYRVRANSMHHLSVAHGTYRVALEGVFRKHRQTIENLGLELLLAKESFLLEQRIHARHLRDRRDELERELQSVVERASNISRSLQELGREPIEWGDLRRLEPISPVWGFDRGKPVDRSYIEEFLATHELDIRGQVLEVKDSGYTERFGGSKVTHRSILDVDSTNAKATIVADLTKADNIAANQFDCFILSQTLHIIFDVRAALFHAHRILKPGGVLLCSLPAVSRINYDDGGDHWRFTEASVRQLFAEFFPLENFQVNRFGNVMACTAFLYGLSAVELASLELDYLDPSCPLIFCVRAVKRVDAELAEIGGDRGEIECVRTLERNAGAILLYHRIASPTQDIHGLCVSPDDFRGHIQHLCKFYHLMALEDLVAAASEGRIPKRAVAITFDDGYLDMLLTASPILCEYKVPATFFINSEFLHEQREFWWDILEQIFVESDLPSLLEVHVAGQTLRFSTSTTEGKLDAHKAVHSMIRFKGRVERDEIMASVMRWSGYEFSQQPERRPMTLEEIARLAQRPSHSIGGHTVHHLSLPAQSLEIQEQEILQNKRELESMLGRPVLTFAYPYGDYDSRTVEIVRNGHFLAAVTVTTDLVRGSSDPMLMPRYEVQANDAKDFAEFMKRVFESDN